MPTVIDLLHFEEGFRDRPYLCSEGYPTVGYGFKLGQKYEGTLEDFNDIYDFELPKHAGDEWLEYILEGLAVEMVQNPVIIPAWKVCDEAHPDLGYMWNPRLAVLISMAYQMGVDGLAKFKKTLGYVATGDFDDAAHMMIQSKWAKQTPNRAKRHAEQMRTGQWAKEYR